MKHLKLFSIFLIFGLLYVTCSEGRVIRFPGGCPPVCAIHCQFGRVYVNGCPTCTCKGPGDGDPLDWIR